MIKRSIIISSPSRLSLKNNQLVCVDLDDEGNEKKAPVEDIGVLLVENQRAVLTVPLINALADNNVAVVFCDRNAMPSSMLLSMSANATQSEMLRTQISAGEALKKRLWKQIIESKIHNQALLLDKIGQDGAILRPYYSNVKSGDIDNREGAAARVYWRALFGHDFTRERDGDGPNKMLNYGYSILRSAVARAIVSSGLNPAFGLFHRNRYNPMPLSDDIMEPYRPFVDEIVYGLYSNGEEELTTEVKSYLVGVLSCDTVFDGIRRPLQIGLSFTTSSLGKCLSGDSKLLALPLLE